MKIENTKYNIGDLVVLLATGYKGLLLGSVKNTGTLRDVEIQEGGFGNFHVGDWISGNDQVVCVVLFDSTFSRKKYGARCMICFVPSEVQPFTFQREEPLICLKSKEAYKIDRITAEFGEHKPMRKRGINFKLVKLTEGAYNKSVNMGELLNDYEPLWMYDEDNRGDEVSGKTGSGTMHS